MWSMCPAWSSSAIFVSSGIHKGHCDVADTGGGGQTFVVVGETARVQKGPAFTRSLNGAVIAEEPASTTLQPRNSTYQQLMAVAVLWSLTTLQQFPELFINRNDTKAFFSMPHCHKLKRTINIQIWAAGKPAVFLLMFAWRMGLFHSVIKRMNL